jgi:hypothetical protein
VIDKTRLKKQFLRRRRRKRSEEISLGRQVTPALRRAAAVLRLGTAT